MKYKGYVGQVSYDDEAKIFHGEVIGLKDVITFQGTNVQEIEEAFQSSIDDYLNWCKERGDKPEKKRSWQKISNVLRHFEFENVT